MKVSILIFAPYGLGYRTRSRPGVIPSPAPTLMLFPEDQVRLWLYSQPTDMRKSYDGLSTLVKNKLSEDPLSGQLFVFINRKRTQMKILYYDRSGYCIWSKRLEQGRFHWGNNGTVKQRLSWTDLKFIVEGIDTRSVKQFKRYQHPNTCGDRV